MLWRHQVGGFKADHAALSPDGTRFSPAGRALNPDSYPNNSAHHGMALSGDTGKLCDAGTIDDYTAIIDRPALSTRGTVSYPPGTLPYWATTSADGRYCPVSLSNANAVSVVDYATAQEVARIPVGTSRNANASVASPGASSHR